MKIAFLVCNDVYIERVQELLSTCGIDYFTRWEQAKGKGHGTDPHLGTRSFPGTNAVFMIAFPEESALEALVSEIKGANQKIDRQDDKIRLFQLPMERIV